jgi:DNA-binding CsgD family transcriptional regulator
MGFERRIRLTIDAVSAAAAGEADWVAVSDTLVGLVGAGTNSLWVGDPALGQVEILGTSCGAAEERRYETYYHRLDLWSHRGAAHRAAGPFFGTELVSTEELQRSEVYTDFFRPLGMFHLLGATVPLGGAAGSMALGLHRPHASHGFEEQEKFALAEVLPHLRRSLRLRHELRLATGAAQAAVAGLAAMGVPALVVDKGRRILFANTAAAALLKAGRGLVSRAGCCIAADLADADAVAALVRKVASGGGGGLYRLRAAPGTAPLTLLASRPVDEGQRGVALLFLLDPAARRAHARAGLIQAVYGLTAAEAEVAEAAARGEAAAAIAARRGTSEATVRVQIRLVLAKTGAETLRALAAMFAVLPDLPG